jgi:hypothetical protein
MVFCVFGVTVLYFIWISVSLFWNFLLTSTFYISVFIYLLNLLLIIVLYLSYGSILTCSALLTELSLIYMLLTCSIFYGLWPVFELPGMRIKWNGMSVIVTALQSKPKNVDIWPDIVENCNFNSHCSENLKSCRQCLCTVRSIISAPPLQNAMSHTTAERNGTSVVASVLRWCDSWHFAAVARLWLNTALQITFSLDYRFIFLRIDTFSVEGSFVFHSFLLCFLC